MLNFGLPYGNHRQIRVQNWHIYHKKKFLNMFITLNIVYMYIYDVSQ